MGATVETPRRAMGAREGTSVRIDTEAVNLAKAAAALNGMKLSEYVSNVVRDAAERDLGSALAKRNKPKGTGKEQ
jgi:hypothetical protein